MEALKFTNCIHVWEELSPAFSKIHNAEGIALRCGNCRTLGFQRTRLFRVFPEKRLKFEYIGEPVVVNGMDIFQAEYLHDGRPLHVWDSHF